MLSDERIETLEDFAAGFANNAFSKTHELHLAYGILELVAELRSVRTREYREPVASDDQTMVWVPDIGEPVRLLPVDLSKGLGYNPGSGAERWQPEDWPPLCSTVGVSALSIERCRMRRFAHHLALVGFGILGCLGLYNQYLRYTAPDANTLLAAQQQWMLYAGVVAVVFLTPAILLKFFWSPPSKS